VKASQLKGRAVVTLSDAAKVGHIDDILFDAQYRRVLGLRIKKNLLGHTEAVTRESVSAVGADAVTVPSPETINVEDRFAEFSGAATLSDAHGTKVVTESGSMLGVIEDLELDEDVRTVAAYTLSAPLWNRLRHGEPRVAAADVLRLGEGGIMVVANSVAEAIKA